MNTNDTDKAERAELIAQLLALGIPDWETARYLMKKAAEMLKSDNLKESK